ncbi:hypothetical protein [Halosegnis marinus]|uniref:Uncharacterized protein n=1 Tax=Halosegnis marinus TaxID=3034023 RepID=A0ABD5ZLJ4_9EURY|nr:hypothetical protein [Halosegnis sp. DT85]
MSWSRCSKAVVAALLVLTAAVAPVAAVSTSSEGVPQEAQVGDEVSATYTFTDLYTDYESWTLRGETNLTGVTWTVRELDQAGNQVSQQSYDGGSFNESVALSDDTARVVVEVRGSAPEVENFTYDPAEEFVLADFSLVRDGGTQQSITTSRVHHYTEASNEARTAIESAQAAIDNAGGDDEAEATLEDAVEAYNNEEFGSATTFAENAEQQAQQAESTQSRNQLILYGVAALLVVAVLVGAVLYWRSRGDSYDKLG